MSINGRYGIDETRVKRFGKNYASIDFDIKDNLSGEDYRTRGEYTPVGNFVIGNVQMPVTVKEIEKIEETAREALLALRQSYQLGLMR
tara:strand:+ start:268 stop:531 length:264 start_codon:yes stop_codon:yes gene_type:complete